MNLPTQLTMLRIILSPVFLYTLFQQHIYFKYISFIIYIIASLTDLYDGYYAKKYGYVTQWGKFLDPLADKILVSSAFIAFYILGYIKLWVVVAIILRDLLITGLRSYALYNNQPIVTRDWARWKTFLQMSSVFIIFIFAIFDYYESFYHKKFELLSFIKDAGLMDKLMVFVAVYTIATGMLYFIENRGQMKNFILTCYRFFLS